MISTIALFTFMPSERHAKSFVQLGKYSSGVVCALAVGASGGGRPGIIELAEPLQPLQTRQ